MAFWEHVTAESVCGRVRAPQRRLGKSAERVLAEDAGLLSRWPGRMLLVSGTKLWADWVTGIQFLFFVWS